jgi:hypothetical protein
LGVCPSVGCTFSHSKQALWTDVSRTPSAAATFVSEEDSGLSLLGLIVLTEPDHYAVLLERARLRFRCDRLLYPQLDFFTDYWLVVAFPIARVTLLCEHDDAPALPGGARPGPVRGAADEPAP